MNIARYLMSAMALNLPAAAHEPVTAPPVQERAPTAGRQPIYGYDSENNAYLVENYPYGGLRTQIRFWLEKSNSKGFRFVSQTKNPKTGRWNNPKASTYSRFGGQMYIDDKNHVTWAGITEFSQGDEVSRFLHDFQDTDKSLIKVLTIGKLRYYKAVVAENERGLSGFSINGKPCPLDQADVERNRNSLADWVSANSLL